jgi:hypothetical protein
MRTHRSNHDRPLTRDVENQLRALATLLARPGVREWLEGDIDPERVAPVYSRLPSSEELHDGCGTYYVVRWVLSTEPGLGLHRAEAG